MSNTIKQHGAALKGGGQKMTPNKEDQSWVDVGRPAPINTTVGRDVKTQSLTATTGSLSAYSPSINTGSSLQFTPGTSSYSPSIWSDGAGTPMSAAGSTDDVTTRVKELDDTPDAHAPKASNSTDSTPSKSGNPNFGTTGNLGASLPPHHVIGGEPGKRYGITYFDKDGVFSSLKYPLTRIHRRGYPDFYLDADGQTCIVPNAANTFPIGDAGQIVASGAAGAPPGSSFSFPGNANIEETYTVVSKIYEHNNELVVPFIEVKSNGIIMSDLTTHYSKTHPHLVGKKPPVFSEEAARDSFKVQLNDPIAKFSIAFPRAMDVLKALNPSHMQMEYGTRVICVKTDYVRNIWWSVDRGVWVTMDKVGERINRLWEERGKGENVLLLFSVNGQKSYCALATLMGPWKEASTEELEGWLEREDGTKTMGVLPLRYSHVKNVSYEYFNNIQHTHNGQPIVNMWNGMHFPYEKGREVVELYHRKAHFTNVLAWRADRSYDPCREITTAAQLDPRLRNTPNDMTIMKRNIAARQATEAQQRQQQPVSERNSPTPTIRDRRGIAAGGINVPPPPPLPSFDGASSPAQLSAPLSAPLPGQFVSCIVDMHGNLVPVNATHQQAGTVEMPSGNNSVFPVQTGAQVVNQQIRMPQQAPCNMRVRGGSIQGLRGSPTGRGGMLGQLRGAHSFVNPGIARLNQNAYGRGMAGGLHSAHSFDNGSTFRGGATAANYAPPMARTQSAQDSTNLLRQAVSKANFFVPGRTASPSPRAPSNANSTGVTTTTTSSNNQTSIDGLSDEDVKALLLQNEKELLEAKKRKIIEDGKFSMLEHQHSMLMAKVMGKDPRAGDLPDANDILDAKSDVWIGVNYAMGSGTTLERRYVSPVRGSDGGILDSASKADSPETKARRREINHRERYFYGQCSDTSRDMRIIKNVDDLVNSPPGSEVQQSKEGEEIGGGVSLE